MKAVFVVEPDGSLVVFLYRHSVAVSPMLCHSSLTSLGS